MAGSGRHQVDPAGWVCGRTMVVMRQFGVIEEGLAGPVPGCCEAAACGCRSVRVSG
jgi:hypothetical protein